MRRLPDFLSRLLRRWKIQQKMRAARSRRKPRTDPTTIPAICPPLSPPPPLELTGAVALPVGDDVGADVVEKRFGMDEKTGKLTS